MTIPNTALQCWMKAWKRYYSVTTAGNRRFRKVLSAVSAGQMSWSTWMVDSNFRDQVEKLMAQVPAGYVTTYGDLAALAGHPYASRVVGGVAHYGNPDLPWHRLVNRFGGLASGYYGGREEQARALLSEGVACTDFIVDDFSER